MQENQQLRICRMQEADTRKAAGIEKRLFSQPWSANAFLETLQKTDSLFAVAWIGDLMAGYCGLLKVCGEGDITNMAVSEEFQRMGIGEKLMTKVMEWSREEGILEFTLEVRVSNGPAIALYKKLGFLVEGIRRDFYEEPREDAFIMWKR